MKTRDSLLSKFREQSVDEPMGADLEDYLDWFGADDELKDVLKRFLESAHPLNRQIVLSVLCKYPDTALGLEADALLLHLQGLDGRFEGFDLDLRGIDYLREIAFHGSPVAKRILALLELDDTWAHIYREWRSRGEPSP